MGRLTNRGRLTEKDVDEALREVRVALLEADVNFRVARELVGRIRERALDTNVLQSLSPGQQVVTFVYEELVAILGEGHRGLQASSQAPSVALMVGLQGSGKTTTAAKLSMYLRRQGHRSLLVAADLRRPAAIQQLATLGRQLDVPVYQEDPLTSTAEEVASHGLEHARNLRRHLGNNRHRRASSRRRGAHGGIGAGEGRHQSQRVASCGGRHDRTGRGERCQLSSTSELA